MDQITETDDFQVEVNNLDLSKNGITNLCRGCLKPEAEGSLRNMLQIGYPLIHLYEQLTTSKIISSNIPSKMCFNCIQELSQTYDFIDMLKDSYKILSKYDEKIKYLNITKRVNSEEYNLEMRHIIQDILREKDLSDNMGNLTDVSKSEIQIENSFSDDKSITILSSSSEDEIQLDERLEVNTEKLKLPLKGHNAELKSKKMTKITNAEENLEGETTYDNFKEEEDIKYVCFICFEEVSNFNKHIEIIHHIDGVNAKCLKCSYINFDKDKLREHCHNCHVELENVTYTNEQNDFKLEFKDETIDPETHLGQNVEDRDNLKDGDDKIGLVVYPKHKRGRKPKKAKYECIKCGEVYTNYEEIESHLKSRHGSETICILCSQKCPNSFTLLYHMMARHGKKKCCRLCLISFADSKELNEHYKSEEHNTKCTFCGKQFEKRKALYEHRRKKHLGPEKYKCPKCQRQFANRENARRHLMVSHYNLRYLCEACGQSLTTRSNLRLHIQNFHEGVQVENKAAKKNFFCETCGKELNAAQRYAVELHKAKHRGHKYVCKKCYESFETEDSLRQHAADSGHQLFECNKCQSQFVREENYKIHVKNHEIPGWNKNVVVGNTNRNNTRTKPRNEKGELFVCTYCPKSFKDRQRCNAHIRVHTNERPYKCHVCGKGFKTATHKNTHMNIHLGIKKWVCRYCSKAFTNSSTLRGHEMIHTGERPHHCPECKKGFITTSALKKHRVVHFKSSNSGNDKKIYKTNRLATNVNETDDEADDLSDSELSSDSFIEAEELEDNGSVSNDEDL